MGFLGTFPRPPKTVDTLNAIQFAWVQTTIVWRLLPTDYPWVGRSYARLIYLFLISQFRYTYIPRQVQHGRPNAADMRATPHLPYGGMAGHYGSTRRSTHSLNARLTILRNWIFRRFVLLYGLAGHARLDHPGTPGDFVFQNW